VLKPRDRICSKFHQNNFRKDEHPKPMDVESIVSALKDERNRIDAALAALSGIGKGNGRRRGRRPGSLGAVRLGRKRTRRLSAAARRKISEAAKARWAQAKKAGRNSL
jgi:hypothetical protein